MKWIASEKIVERILSDLTDRRGFRQQWESTDDETQAEIKEAWYSIIDAEIDLHCEKCEQTFGRLEER